jgi:NAD(P)-dependent dehydrogenase (short-subunit alcohol dehydrogenase family)
VSDGRLREEKLVSADTRVALVTGAGRNVGQGIAEALAAAGYSVAVNDVHEDRAQTVAAAIGKDGGSAIAVPFDVTSLAQVREGVAEVGRQLGAVDILVNNAGIPENFAPGKFSDTPPDAWHVQVDINLYGAMNCIHTVLPHMCEQRWGRIIQISAGSAATGRNIGVSLYAASKAGIESLLRHLSYEIAPYSVTTNSLALGLIETERTRAAGGNPTQQMLLERVPIARLGTPAEIGGAVVWLCSESGAFVTGQTIHLNGGSYNGR